jgi:hypothetical protein
MKKYLWTLFGIMIHGYCVLMNVITSFEASAIWLRLSCIGLASFSFTMIIYLLDVKKSLYGRSAKV